MSGFCTSGGLQSDGWKVERYSFVTDVSGDVFVICVDDWIDPLNEVVGRLFSVDPAEVERVDISLEVTVDNMGVSSSIVFMVVNTVGKGVAVGPSVPFPVVLMVVVETVDNVLAILSVVLAVVNKVENDVEGTGGTIEVPSSDVLLVVNNVDNCCEETVGNVVPSSSIVVAVTAKAVDDLNEILGSMVE